MSLKLFTCMSSFSLLHSNSELVLSPWYRGGNRGSERSLLRKWGLRELGSGFPGSQPVPSHSWFLGEICSFGRVLCHFEARASLLQALGAWPLGDWLSGRRSEPGPTDSLDP